ncbi:MAG: glycosyltransferase [archaeon]|nr:glycosyltransferase [archaeon]
MSSNESLHSDKKMLFAAWTANNKKYFAYQTFYFPLKKIFKHFISFDPQEYMIRYGKEEMNKKFLEIVKKEKPDFIFMWLIYDEFYIDTLLKIKELSPKTKTINIFTDDDTLFDKYSRHYALIFDYKLVSQNYYLKDYRKEGIDNIFDMAGANIETNKPIKSEKKYDVTFIGTPKVDRYELIKFLKKNKIDVKIFGFGWEKYADLKDIWFGPVDQKEVNRIMNQSKINLCFSKNYLGGTHLNCRIFEIMAKKSFGIIEYFKGSLKLFKNNEEIVMFKDKEDLLKKVKYYLKNEYERKRIAKNAYNCVIKKYSINKKIENIFNKIFSEKNKDTTTLPKIDYRLICLDKSDMCSNITKIRKKLNGYDYVCFKSNNFDSLKYKDYFQANSLKKSGKSISCCDYYVYSAGLGDYLIFSSYLAFKFIDQNDFSSLINIGQLMVKKSYFLNNFDKFKDLFYNKKVEIINVKNTIFVAIPLIRVTKINEISADKIDKCFYPIFENNFKKIGYNNRIMNILLLYKLLSLSYSCKKAVLNYTFHRMKSVFFNKIS